MRAHALPRVHDSPRPALALACALALGCAPHEVLREPTPTCPDGMAWIDGGRHGGQALDPLCVDIHEVTTAAFAACIDAGACAQKLTLAGERCNLVHRERGQHPVNCVGRRDAESFCAWLGKRLPSDIEWDWVARGGARGTTYPWGDAPIDATRACWTGASPQERQRATPVTCEVGSRTQGASPEGVDDLVGNVAEWTHRSGQNERERYRLRGGLREPDAADSEAAGPTIAVLDPDSDAREQHGFRCVVPPGSAAREVETGTWTPLTPAPRELPVVYRRTSIPAPTRPLANLAPLWHHVEQDGDPPDTLWPIGAGLTPVDRAGATALGLTGGFRLDDIAPRVDGFYPSRAVGSSILLTTGYGGTRAFLMIERGTRKIQWQAAPVPEGRSYAHFLSPRALVSEFYGPKVDVVVGLGLSDGSELWRKTGGPDVGFTRVHSLWTDGARGYLVGDGGLMAFDPTTGATRWSGVAVGEHCGVVTGDDLVIVEDPKGHRKLDAKTGAQLGVIPRPDPGPCRWGRYDDGVASAVIDRGALYVFDGIQDKKTRLTPLRAVDLASGVVRWQRGGIGARVLVASHDAVLVDRAGKTVVALDAATGAPQVEVSIGDFFELEIAPTSRPEGPLVLVHNEGAGEWILGRVDPRVEPEAYTVSGRLVAEDELPRRAVAGVRVRVGDRVVRSDRSGRFRARGVTLGAVQVESDDAREAYELMESDVGRVLSRFDETLVVLEGRGTYDLGDIPLYRWYLE